ncbi:hypothetical protein WN55_09001 [Dufourea novaeangliae]|uniref:Uncharacterized protein n=1 Tax=Dufourea novaeangliae TaxID=178035 RepID=A0A154P5Z9_DUFNO|nr:hypothetical protein WN55_09001 [Dufourea novaeangliae]
MGNYLGVEEALSEKFCQSVRNWAIDMFNSRVYYAMVVRTNNGNAAAAVQAFGYRLIASFTTPSNCVQLQGRDELEATPDSGTVFEPSLDMGHRPIILDIWDKGLPPYERTTPPTNRGGADLVRQPVDCGAGEHRHQRSLIIFAVPGASLCTELPTEVAVGETHHWGVQARPGDGAPYSNPTPGELGLLTEKPSEPEDSPETRRFISVIVCGGTTSYIRHQRQRVFAIWANITCDGSPVSARTGVTLPSSTIAKDFPPITGLVACFSQ